MTTDMVRFGRRVFAAVLIVCLVAAIAYSIQIILLVFAGILLAILVHSAGSWLSERTHLSINWCTPIVLIAFLAFVLGSISIFGVQIANQADALFQGVSQAYRELHDKLAQYQIGGSFSAGLSLEKQASAAASGLVSMVASTVLVFFIGGYLAIAPRLYSDLFLSFFDDPLRDRVNRLLIALAAALRWWLAGQLIAMAVVGIITTVGLLLIGAPMAISLGVVAAILTFVPYVGAIVSGIPAVLLALTQSGDMAMSVILVYLVAHVVEGYIVVPMIQHKLVYLPPATILVAQFFMELFAGTVGVTFATPLMVVAMVLIKKIYFKQEWDEPLDETKAA